MTGDMEALQVHERHVGKFRNRTAVRLYEPVHRIFAALFRVSRLTAGQYHAGGHALYVPLPRGTDGLVEIIDVKNQRAARSGICSDVANVSVTADLGGHSAGRQAGQVSGHQRDRSAEKSEGRGGHTRHLDGNQPGHAATIGSHDQIKRIKAPFAVPLPLRRAADQLTQAPPVTPEFLCIGDSLAE